MPIVVDGDARIHIGHPAIVQQIQEFQRRHSLQTLNSSFAGTPNASAILWIFTRLIFRSPRSTPPIYVRSRSQVKATASSTRSLTLRNSRTRCRTAAEGAIPGCCSLPKVISRDDNESTAFAYHELSLLLPGTPFIAVFAMSELRVARESRPQKPCQEKSRNSLYPNEIN